MKVRSTEISWVLSLGAILLLWSKAGAGDLPIQPNTKAPNTNSIQATIKESLKNLSGYMGNHTQRSTSRPFVTLAYAQSLDGKIAIVKSTSEGEPHKSTSSNFAISSSESLLLTHALRSMHDAVLVGGRTLEIDNPRLNNRLWKPQNRPGHQPRPVVLDPTLQYVESLGSNIRAQNNLIVCCTHQAAASYFERNSKHQKEFSLTLLPCQTQGDGQLLDLQDALFQLRTCHGIQSVMVEGGAGVISSFVREKLVDYQCVTISPQLLGDAGLPSIGDISVDRGNCIKIGPLKSISLGPDCVVFSRWNQQE